MKVVIFPTQLFDKKYLPNNWKTADIYLVEEPVHWGTEKGLKLNMNQLKLVLHRASMKFYQDQLMKWGAKSVKYIQEKSIRGKNYYPFLSGSGHVVLYDPTDHTIMKKIKNTQNKFKSAKFNILFDTPNFLLSSKDCKDYQDLKLKESGKNAKKVKNYFHQHFYTWAKKRLNLQKVIGSKTYDTENRNSLPKNIKLIGIPKVGYGAGQSKPQFNFKQHGGGSIKSDKKYVEEAIKYIKSNYGSNYGDAKDFYLPISHKTSIKWFKYFLDKKFNKFGDYQDAISQSHPFLFHSVISPMLNIGLLDPKEIVDETIKFYKKHKTGKNKIGKNDFEGFLRQIIGWREYSRFLYVHAFDEIKNSNHFGHKNKLSKKWYTGELGIKPVDWTIKVAFKYGYLHHILRLMMMANFMNLCEIHPDQVFKWFMEFAMDSYQWVMHNNIYSMGTYADGGLTMRKPYLSSSNYILKMSDFKKDGHWDVIWTDLFYRFLVKQEKDLKGTPYVRNLSHYNSKSAKEKKELMNRANAFIRNVT
tara:strand:- start:1132 stop:2715 length:1584 start_codon:yes stop_codon:yes gene_type:complete